MSDKFNHTGLSKMDINEQLGLLNSILDSSTEYSIFALDLNKKILAWNKGATRLYGYTPTEVIGQSSDILYSAGLLKSGKVDAIFVEVREKGNWSGQLQRIRKDGTQFTAFITITLRKDGQDTPVGYTVISRDITELQNALHILDLIKKSDQLLRVQNKKLENATRAAEAANRLKSEFIANVSHELRTPLNGILGFTQLLYDDMVPPSSPKHKEFLGHIISSGNQLLQLINEVLDLAKIEANKMEFHPEKIHLEKILSDLKDTFQSRITEKNIQLDIQIDPTLGDIIIDPEKLTQVFNNYLSNSFKFSLSNSRISIRILKDKNDYFRLEVEDTGIGIKAEEIGKLFTKFHQINASTTKEYQGTGLGLALTKRIVEAQGGSVGVSSTFGKGSVFYAMLPCQPEHRHLIPNGREDSQDSSVEKQPTLLVVEHESRERAIIVDALTQEGYQVVTAENAIGAVDEHHKQYFDAIILDLLQPDMDNWEMIRMLRSQLSSNRLQPLIVKVMIDQPISFGFEIHDFLIKPVKAADLLSALEWTGAIKYTNKSILIIDHDQKTLEFAKQTLTEFGFNVLCASTKVSGLLALEKEQPDAVILDPFMLETDGFEVLRSYRQTERGLYTPLIIWTESKLSNSQRKRFKNLIQRVMLREDFLKETIISELGKHLPPLKEVKAKTEVEY